MNTPSSLYFKPLLEDKEGLNGQYSGISETFSPTSNRGMLLLTKAKRPLKFKMLCGFNKHAVKLRMHKAAPYAFPIPVNTF